MVRCALDLALATSLLATLVSESMASATMRRLGQVLTISTGDWTLARRRKGESRPKAGRIKLVLHLGKDQPERAIVVA